MNSVGLNTFYCSNIRSLLSYAAPAWFTLLGDTNLEKLKKVQCSATRIILPDYEYYECLKMSCIPSLAKFLHKLSKRHINKIVSDLSYPPFCRISLIKCRCLPPTTLFINLDDAPKTGQIFLPFLHV